jgi:hypothetical protein
VETPKVTRSRPSLPTCSACTYEWRVRCCRRAARFAAQVDLVVGDLVEGGGALRVLLGSSGAAAVNGHRFLPAGGHVFSPLVAIGSPQRAVDAEPEAGEAEGGAAVWRAI